MNSVPLRDIIIQAKQESHRMRHRYLGVEHLFIALLSIRGGLASNILSEYGLTPEYITEIIRRKIGKGGKRHLWAGFPQTQRAESILSIAQDIALENKRRSIEERDLLLAILEEGDSLPARVLVALGLDLATLRDAARTRKVMREASRSFVHIDIPPSINGELDPSQLYILRKMFHGYDRIQIKKRLTGGYAASNLLVVVPAYVDREDAPVVVKIGATRLILDEAQRYEQFVKNTLPALTARLEERPVAPENSNLAGLKYTFLTDSDGNPTDMRAVVQDWSGPNLGKWLQQNLYQYFGTRWWQQQKDYRFEAWSEYDWLLPPVLTLKLSREEQPPVNASVLRPPIRRNLVRSLSYGDAVIVENFIVYRVDKDKNSITLALGQGTDAARPFQLEVREIDFERESYFRGEAVERVTGTIWRTRDEQLELALRELSPDFATHGDYISVNNIQLPNPVRAYRHLLDTMVEGTMSIIHGDLHLGNVMLGPNQAALLIDFGRARYGHTLFDWANLEISIISERLVPMISPDWDGARNLLQHLVFVNHPERTRRADPQIADAIQSVVAVRQVVQRHLAQPGRWEEYYLSLALTALRAMNWKTMPLASRRVMYLVSALAMYEFENRNRDSDTDNTPSPDVTDFMTND